MKPSRAVVFLNVSAGSLVGGTRAEFEGLVRQAFQARGIEADIRFPPPDRLTAEAARIAAEVEAGRWDAVIAGGGDGSISAVASGLVGTRCPLGVLPLGTLNHFAGDLGIPPSLEEAVDVIASGLIQSVDTGHVNGRTFVNNSSIGLYPYMVLERERTRRRAGLPKWLAMAWAAWRVFRFFPLRRLSIPAAGRKPYRSPCVFVGNNEYHLSGPLLGRRQRLADGLLSLYIADQQSRAALLRFAARLLLGRVDPARDLALLSLDGFEIHSRPRRRLLISLDGEIVTMRTPLRYEIRPASLRVFAPAPQTRDLSAPAFMPVSPV